MVEEFDFDGEDFDDVLEAEEEEVTKYKKPIKREVVKEESAEEFLEEEPVAPRRAAPPIAPKKPQPIAQQPRPTAIQQQPAPKKIEERFTAYNVTSKVGIFDNVTQQPMMESADPITLILSMQTEILNRLDKIEGAI